MIWCTASKKYGKTGEERGWGTSITARATTPQTIQSWSPSSPLGFEGNGGGAKERRGISRVILTIAQKTGGEKGRGGGKKTSFSVLSESRGPRGNNPTLLEPGGKNAKGSEEKKGSSGQLPKNHDPRRTRYLPIKPKEGGGKKGNQPNSD